MLVPLFQIWVHKILDHKASLIGGVLAIISLSLAHYAGFLMKVPLQIVAVAGGSLAKGVTATFLFYLFFCAVSARVIASVLLIALLPALAIQDRLEGGIRREMSWSSQRRFVRSHTRTIKWENYIWLFIQSLIFLLLMLAIYVKFSMTWISGLVLIGSVLLIALSGLVRSGFFLQPKWKTFVRKNKSRPARFSRVVSASIVTVTGALIVVAFLLGGMRGNLLRSQEPGLVLTKDFVGMATVIASSGDELLLFQKKGNDFRYIYSAAGFTASFETAPVFPVLERNSDPAPQSNGLESG